MFKVKCEQSEEMFADLTAAMNHAKLIGKFVTIVGEGMEIVGCFGVDAVEDGKCPDGVAYDWNKASRIGAPKRSR